MRKSIKNNLQPMRITEKAYWKAALAEFGDVRKLCLAALMVALSVVLQKFSLKLSPGLEIRATFFVAALSGVFFGPFLALLRGVVADLVGFMLFPTGAFAIGYTVQAGLCAFIYSLGFNRKNIGVGRILATKATISIVGNVLFGSYLSYHYYHTYFPVSFMVSAAKNIILFPLEVFALAVFFNAVLPQMSRLKLCPANDKINTNKKMLIWLIICAVIFFAFVIVCMVIPDKIEAIFKSIYEPIRDYLKSIVQK